MFEKTPLLTTKDTALKVVQDSTETDEVTAKVKDGYAVVEIELRPKADTDFKKWLTTLKIDGKPSDRKKSYLFIEAKEKDNPSIKEFYKEQGFKIISTNWHEPVDDPQIAMFTQNGNPRPQNNVFGMARGYNHTGLDIFVLEGSNAYACLDGVVQQTQEWVSSGNGYGHSVIIKVTNPQEFINRKREYTKDYKSELNNNTNFDINSEVFLLRYCHLEDILVRTGDKVKAGEIIGKTGISGVVKGTCDPHLHFNIYSDKRYDSYLTNPAHYVYWKKIKDLSEADIKVQTDRKDLYPTEKDRIKNANLSPEISIDDPKRIKV